MSALSLSFNRIKGLFTCDHVWDYIESTQYRKQRTSTSSIVSDYDKVTKIAYVVCKKCKTKSFHVFEMELDEQGYVIRKREKKPLGKLSEWVKI